MEIVTEEGAREAFQAIDTASNQIKKKNPNLNFTFNFKFNVNLFYKTFINFFGMQQNLFVILTFKLGE